MNLLKDYIEVNKKLWNERTKAHVSSTFYAMPSFLSGKSSLNEIELELLGDLSGKSVLHLQCHFGQDSLSLARMGAAVTGVDLSDEAIDIARELASKLELDATFICCDIYDLPLHLHQQFDVVFTSYGTIGWLPDLSKWAAIVSQFLKPQGSFVFVEFHPAVWMFDNELTHVQYSYFNKEVIIENEQGTYADKAADISLASVSWNHSIAEVLQSLLDQQLCLKQFRELDYSPYNIFPGMIEVTAGKYQIEKMKGKLPLVYALQMEKL
ncbi:MAG TPA: class I SAM-dependent methyltransferase [Flavipsychrobacter sp.]|nr:class I SAM-dependent methyltransferase [Flavipsychrobacter sp.]